MSIPRDDTVSEEGFTRGRRGDETGRTARRTFERLNIHRDPLSAAGLGVPTRLIARRRRVPQGRRDGTVVWLGLRERLGERVDNLARGAQRETRTGELVDRDGRC